MHLPQTITFNIQAEMITTLFFKSIKCKGFILVLNDTKIK